KSEINFPPFSYPFPGYRYVSSTVSLIVSLISHPRIIGVKSRFRNWDIGGWGPDLMVFVFSTISAFIVRCLSSFLRGIESRMHVSGLIVMNTHGISLCNSVTASGAEFRSTESVRRRVRTWTSDAVVHGVSVNR